MADLVSKPFGECQIAEEIDQGEMTVVCKAWQARINLYMILKVLAPHPLWDLTFV